MQDIIRRQSGEKWDKAYVSRESKEASLLISIPGKCRLQRTRWLSACNEYRTQCYDLSTDPEGRATCGCFPAIGFLK
jgi:hypothetical protein